MTTYYRCIGQPPTIPPCGVSGVYEHAAISGDSGPAWQHTKATGHSTVTSSREWAGAVE
jgi:hypothetical protein